MDGWIVYPIESRRLTGQALHALALGRLHRRHRHRHRRRLGRRLRLAPSLPAPQGPPVRPGQGTLGRWRRPQRPARTRPLAAQRPPAPGRLLRPRQHQHRQRLRDREAPRPGAQEVGCQRADVSRPRLCCVRVRSTSSLSARPLLTLSHMYGAHTSRPPESSGPSICDLQRAFLRSGVTERGQTERRVPPIHIILLLGPCPSIGMHVPF